MQKERLQFVRTKFLVYTLSELHGVRSIMNVGKMLILGCHENKMAASLNVRNTLLPFISLLKHGVQRL